MSDETILVRLKLQNGRAFTSEIVGAGGAVKHFGNEVHTAGKKTEFTRAETFLWRQGIYTLRRELFYGYAAVAAFAAGTVKLGLTFDEAEKSGTAAFTGLLGSERIAKREMRDLTQVTHQTGLQLTTITDAAIRMQGFGFATRESTRDLRILGNYAERARLGPSGFDTLVGIFDRIKQSGQLGRAEIRTLTAQGVPALQILRRELHLTGLQYRQLQRGKLIIPARYALPALATGLEGRSNLLGTNLGQEVGVAHSYLSQIFGTGEKGLFGFATRGLGRVNEILKRASAGQQTGGTHGLLLGLDPSAKLLRGWEVLTSLLHAASSTILFVWKVAWPLRVLLGGVAFVLGVVASQTGLVTLGFKALALWYLITRGRVLALLIVEKAKLAIDKAQLIYTWLGVRSIQAYELWTMRATIATAAQTKATILWNTAQDASIGKLVVMRRLLTGIVALGVITVGIEVFIHRKQIDAFGKSITDKFTNLQQGWSTNALAKSEAWSANLVPGVHVDWRDLTSSVDGRGGVRKTPGAANGANVTADGDLLVGERGPEILRVRKGAQVQPLPKLSERLGGMLRLPPIEAAPVNMDGRKVADMVFGWKDTAGARV